MPALSRWLRARGALLRERAVGDIVEDLERLAARWLEGPDRWLGEAVGRLAEATGYAPAVLRHSLERYFAAHRRPLLNDLLLDHLGGGAVLDGFVPSAAGRTRAVGPALTFLSAAGHVPVAALPSLFHALLVKSPCLARVSSSEPVMLPLLARALWQVAPLLGGCVAVLGWPSDAEETTRAAVAEAEAVIAYGSDAALERIAALLSPRQRFLAYGHRLSFGVIGRERLRAGETVAATAAAAATDVAAYDQQGCMSPRWFFVEEGGETSAEAFGEQLAAALARREADWPPRPLSAAEASAIHQLRAAWTVRDDARLWASPGAGWTVIHGGGAEEGRRGGVVESSAPLLFHSSALPFFRSSPLPLPRLALLCPVPDAVAGLPDLRPVSPYLQTVACALRPERLQGLAERLAPLGVTRFCPLGQAQDPPLQYHHDGRKALQALVRWVDLEAP